MVLPASYMRSITCVFGITIQASLCTVQDINPPSGRVYRCGAIYGLIRGKLTDTVCGSILRSIILGGPGIFTAFWCVLFIVIVFMGSSVLL